ncbi:hypothetical protein CN275_00220 [Bacillus anthracis]|nr:hypothetical protein CN275_00220 [Bacillus anthracis]
MTEREFFTLVTYKIQKDENEMIRQRSVTMNAHYNLNRGKKRFIEFPFEKRDTRVQLVKTETEKEALFAMFGGQVKL